MQSPGALSPPASGRGVPALHLPGVDARQAQPGQQLPRPGGPDRPTEHSGLQAV